MDAAELARFAAWYEIFERRNGMSGRKMCAMIVLTHLFADAA
ncbi:MAG TPA: hypothetical protein VMU81_24255 [Acetobacteraceae bacterium]|nr:hypothetical protein [Acetobacteraceae bacterium]